MALMLRLLRLLRPVRGMMAMSIALSLLAMLASIGLLAVSGWFIAAMGLAGAAGAAMNYFTPAAIIRALAITRTGGRYAERVVSHEATFRVLASLRRWFYDRLEPLAPAVLTEQASGDLLARIRNDIERLELVFLRTVSPVIVASLAVVIVTGVLAAYHSPSALALLALLVGAGALLPIYALRRGAVPSRALTVTSAEMKAVLVDGLNGLAELQLAGSDADFRERVDELTERHIDNERRLARLQGVLSAVNVLAASFAMFAVLLLLVPAVREGLLTPPDLPALLMLALASFEAVVPLPLAFQSLPGVMQSARRLFELVDRPPVVMESATQRNAPMGHDVRFDKVSFRYSADLPAVLCDIELELAEGRRIAVLGETGSGKSSLVNLLVRFWDPTSGAITLGGVPIRDMTLDSVRARISVQQQQPHLFAATIRDNLLLARPDATQGHIEAAAEAAQVHDFIMSLPNGYDTFIGAHGRLVSGGEARRLAIAQALLKPAPILVLDEPTEGLDPVTAEALMRGILDFARDRSVLLITHRAVGLQAMDFIVVLDAGRIAACGDLASLAGSAGPLHALKTRIDA